MLMASTCQEDVSIIYNFTDTSPECVDGADIQKPGRHSRLSGNDGKSLRPAERLMRRIKTGDEAMPWPELLNWIIDY